MSNTIQKAVHKADNAKISVPLGVDYPRKVAREHLMKEIMFRRDKLKAIGSRGEPIPIELIVEI